MEILIDKNELSLNDLIHLGIIDCDDQYKKPLEEIVKNLPDKIIIEYENNNLTKEN